MLEKFKQHITKHQLLREGNKPLLAVSGGVDSVVMCDLFARLGIAFGLAHCNFLLRGKMSDEDEQFTSDLAKKYGATYHAKRFNTKKIAAERSISIQVAARDLRYEWFAEIMEREGYTCLATAHHANDAVETVLYHLTRGTGIRGLHGIPTRRERIIRPILFATKEDIHAYATQQALPYREDASNAETKYARNKIRLEVVPVLKEINPSLEATFQENIERFKDAEVLYDFAIEHIRSKVFSAEGVHPLAPSKGGDDGVVSTKDEGDNASSFSQNEKSPPLEDSPLSSPPLEGAGGWKNAIYHINIPALLSYPAPATVLYELLRDFGFRQAQTEQIFAGFNGQPGAKYESATHEILRDRDALIIRKKDDSKIDFLFIEKEKNEVVFNNNLFIFKFIKKEKFTFDTSPNIACLDADKLRFPLKLRYWQQGDLFQPLGMKGKHQLVSDFFTNKKLSQFEKENIPILTSNNDMCWIAGHRIDERFKITDETTQVLVIQLITNH